MSTLYICPRCNGDGVWEDDGSGGPCGTCDRTGRVDPIASGTKGTCPVCDRVLGIVNPKGGDGSVRVMLFHKPTVGKPYRLVRDRPRCAGTNQPAKEWTP